MIVAGIVKIVRTKQRFAFGQPYEKFQQKFAMSVRPIRRQNPDGGRQEGNNKETSQLPLSQETSCDEILCSRSTDRALIFPTIKKSTSDVFL